MKKVFFIVTLVSAAFFVQAQTSFGVKAGANFTTLTGGDIEGAKMKVGFNAGALANISASENIKIQPEAIFSLDGAKEDGSDFTINEGYVRIPVMIQYVTSSGFFAEVGPQLGILVSAKAKSGGSSVDFKDYFKSTDVGAAFGIGYKLESGIGFNARYNLGLAKIADDGSDVKNSGFAVGLFYMFGGEKK